MSKDELKALYQAAKQAQDKAYAPYSRFKVGAAIMDDQQRISAGCNVENAAYPIGCCAEQAAVAHMIMSGSTSIAHILIVGSDGKPWSTLRSLPANHI